MATTTSANALDCLATVSTEPPLMARRVLIIEPQPDDAATLQGWVEATGRFDVTVVPYFPQTDDLLLAEDWALIVVDLHEPAIEDVELVRRARATRGWTPVLLIVASDRDDQLSRALRASADDVLVGRVTAVEIVGALMHLVQDAEQVAERRALERSLEQRRVAAAVEPLAAGIAHQLNNKLAPAVGFAELLIHQLDGHLGGPLDSSAEARVVEYCHAVRDSAEAASDVVRRLLTMSKSSGLVRVSLDLRDVVREGLRSLRTRITENAVHLDMQLPAEPVRVLADVGQLRPVIIGLVHNAIDAMQDVATRVLRVQIAVDGRDAVIEICDSGHGVDDAALKHVFEPFYASNGRPGLELSFCYAIVRQHHGELTIESEPGQGARLRIRLPLEQPPAALSALLATASSATTTATAAGVDVKAALTPRGSAVSLLIIDADPAVTQLASDLMAQRPGWRVEVAADALDAVLAIEERQFDLVVCDTVLPQLSGQQIRDWVAARHAHLLPRLLLMTSGQAGGPDTVSGTVGQWVQKPLVARTFAAECEALLATVRPH